MTNDLRFGFAPVFCWVALFVPGCAGHRVPETEAKELRPHISWEIRTGRRGGDEVSVCSATQPSVPCTLQSSAAGDAAATVHLYLHAGKEQISYAGQMMLPFLEGHDGHGAEVISATVPPGSRPVGHMVSGRIAKPGVYDLTISVEATAAAATTPERITAKVPVTVR